MRAHILQLLRSRYNSYVSGEEVSRQLKVSRTAVWKQIQSLKQAGYHIETHPKRGYALSQIPDLLLPEEIRHNLSANMLGRFIHYYQEIGSTNDEAKVLASAGAAAGTLVIAEQQHAGRGRLARGWFSPPAGGIWLSVILRPPFLPAEAPKCTLMAAVALSSAIRKTTGLPCGIKWPNDILVEGKKVAGILTEMSAEIDIINYIVIGMGINVNITKEDFPPELQDVGTSLQIAGGRQVNRLDLLRVLLAELEDAYEISVKQGFGSLLDRWRHMSVTIGQTVDVTTSDEAFAGVAADIDAEGALLVDTISGRRRVIAGDVSIRPRS